jgi:hypothetical protein
LESRATTSLNNQEATTIWRRPLVWLNLVCLDAPLIAVSWKWLFAREFGVVLSTSATQALFLTAWLIYAADRFADAISLQASHPKSLRHEFCLRHKLIWLAAIVGIGLIDAGVLLTRLEPELFRLGLFLGTPAIVYLLINYRFNRVWQTMPVKECLIGFLFAAGTLFAPAARVFSLTSNFIVMGFLFALLCSLNCMSIAVWERDLDQAQGKYSIATRWARTDLFVPVLLIVLFAICLVFAFVDPGLRSLALCLGVSAILLAALQIVPVARDERTALADLVLLTPLAVFVAGKIL